MFLHRLGLTAVTGFTLLLGFNAPPASANWRYTQRVYTWSDSYHRDHDNDHNNREGWYDRCGHFHLYGQEGWYDRYGNYHRPGEHDEFCY